MLFKEGRPNTGENWAEKIACELAEKIGMPHAFYDLATYQDKQGVVSKMLVDRGARLIHGNEILASNTFDYGGDQLKVYRQRDHTLRRVLGYFRRSADLVGAPYGFAQTKNITSSLDVFIGYLMFDTWIANQDRHDQNWALLRTTDGNSFLSPSYDHGSSMGRNESDAKRTIMLNTKDKNQSIAKYVLGARSALYPHPPTDAKLKAYRTMEAFLLASKMRPAAFEEWKERLAQVTDDAEKDIIAKIPGHLMSDESKTFTLELLRLNRLRILESDLS